MPCKISVKSVVFRQPQMEAGVKKISMVFVMSNGPKTSEKISDVVLKKRLAACVNRVPGIISRYWWKGKLEKAREELLIIKTKRLNVPKLIREIKKVHPYEVPEVIAVDVSAGSEDYMNWVVRETDLTRNSEPGTRNQRRKHA
jgi:periplasmic divalent cation tolerance protein